MKGPAAHARGAEHDAGTAQLHHEDYSEYSQLLL